MFILGISGSTNPVGSNELGLPEIYFHDSAAALLHDDAFVAAVEEERCNRIKHTNKFPHNAIKACLDAAGIGLDEVDRLAIYIAEDVFDASIEILQLRIPDLRRKLGVDDDADLTPRLFVRAVVRRELGYDLSADRLYFVKHHVTHAESAFALSGFDRALVVTMDGGGDNEAGSVSIGSDRGLQSLCIANMAESIGVFYYKVTAFLGFRHFDEYKIMGLAPYGNAALYRGVFDTLCKLLPDGRYEFHADLNSVLESLFKRRDATAPLEQRHMDLAAATQEALERVVFHVLKYFREMTGLTKLCLSGGVAHNCTLNGKILESGLFSEMFVQPASHDAGCAVGAALFARDAGGVRRPTRPMPHLFLGRPIGDSTAVRTALKSWEPLLTARKSLQVCEEAAMLLAAGNTIGWVQGRAEFGPRALGQRSILADPRPAENKQIINAMVKKREGFRPFAPAVLAERASEFFEIPECAADLSHMTYVLKVRKDKRELLGAVTHVDGSARVQSVNRTDNERFWKLIDHFCGLVGVPILLNTSFNNNAEPIVDSVDDAIVCFLTTGLHYLVVDDYIVTKFELTYDLCRSLVLSIPKHVTLRHVRRPNDSGKSDSTFEIANSFNDRIVTVSSDAFRLLEAADAKQSLDGLLRSMDLCGTALFGELVELWSRRVIKLAPGSRS